MVKPDELENLDTYTKYRLLRSYCRAFLYLLDDYGGGHSYTMVVVNPQNNKKKVINYKTMTMDRIYEELEEIVTPEDFLNEV